MLYDLSAPIYRRPYVYYSIGQKCRVRNLHYYGTTIYPTLTTSTCMYGRYERNKILQNGKQYLKNASKYKENKIYL